MTLRPIDLDYDGDLDLVTGVETLQFRDDNLTVLATLDQLHCTPIPGEPNIPRTVR